MFYNHHKKSFAKPAISCVLVFSLTLSQLGFANQIHPKANSSVVYPANRELVENTEVATVQLNSALANKKNRIALRDRGIVATTRDFLSFMGAGVVVPVSIALISSSVTYKTGIALTSVLQQEQLRTSEYFDSSRRRNQLQKQYDRYLVSDSFNQETAKKLEDDFYKLDTILEKTIENNNYMYGAATWSWLASLVAGLYSLKIVPEFFSISHKINRERLNFLMQNLANNAERLMGKDSLYDKDIYEAYFNVYTFLQLIDFEPMVVSKHSRRSSEASHSKTIALRPIVDKYSDIDAKNYDRFWPTKLPLIKIELRSKGPNLSIVKGKVTVKLSEPGFDSDTFTLLTFQSAEVGFVKRAPFPEAILGSTIDSFTYKNNINLLNNQAFSKRKNKLEDLIQAAIETFKEEVAEREAQILLEKEAEERKRLAEEGEGEGVVEK